MTPEIRAIADRFILDTANLKYLATALPKGGLEREVPDSEWSVRQLLRHLVDSLERYVELSGAFLERGDVPAGLDTTECNAMTAEAARKTTLPALLGRCDAALSALLGLLAAMPEEAAGQPFGPLRFGDALGAWSKHTVRHGLDLVDAVEELRLDPMALNWILHADFSADAALLARQQHLLAEVRDHLAGDGDDWDDEDGWEEGEDEAL